jgi:hypothetical protein
LITGVGFVVDDARRFSLAKVLPATDLTQILIFVVCLSTNYYNENRRNKRGEIESLEQRKQF